MSSYAYDLLRGGEQRGNDLLAGGEQKGPELLSFALSRRAEAVKNGSVGIGTRCESDSEQLAA